MRKKRGEFFAMSLACCFTCELSATANIHLDSCKVQAGGVFSWYGVVW